MQDLRSVRNWNFLKNKKACNKIETNNCKNYNKEQKHRKSCEMPDEALKSILCKRKRGTKLQAKCKPSKSKFINSSRSSYSEINNNKYSKITNNNSSSRNWHSRTLTLSWIKITSNKQKEKLQQQHCLRKMTTNWCHKLAMLVILLISISNFPTMTTATTTTITTTTTFPVKADNIYASTTPLTLNQSAWKVVDETQSTASTTPIVNDTEWLATTADWLPLNAEATTKLPTANNISHGTKTENRDNGSKIGGDSIFMRFAKRFSTGNELWDGIIRDCYYQPTLPCFQKNVYVYLNDALEARDVNVTQRLKFFKNHVNYEEQVPVTVTQASAAKDTQSAEEDEQNVENNKEHFIAHAEENEIPNEARTAETPIEEVTTALYGKSVKFAMTHDVELKLPELLFDGATLRISPRSVEGNGIIAKLELIPKQEVEARLAGKVLLKKIQKFFKSKLLMSFLALVLIIKIIKIKLFWLLPLVVGVGAAKKLLLKFLLFLFPALSHLFKLCSYYQQNYHQQTKYHHHHHLINHHHTIVPAWHAPEHHDSIPEVIYTHPPKGHISAYLHGAPIHETYGPPGLEHNEGGWENSGPGLGSEFISDINRVAQIKENSNYFEPHTKDANVLNAWGLGTTPSNTQQQQAQKQRLPATQQQRPPTQIQKQRPQHSTASQNFNPFSNKQSIFTTKLKAQTHAQSAPSPVYTPPRGPPRPPQHGEAGLDSNAAQIAAQYSPTRSNLQSQQQLQQQQQQLLQQQLQQLSPEVAAQLKEAIRIQAEQRIVEQQQKILDNQPFVQDGQPLMPKNYDPFYSPILLKIDKILEQLGVTDELCKERLVCSMYKKPEHYSPHSNFVSAELSRDTSELQPVSNPNAAVVRFYRLIQAARDGQEQRDCLRLYPQCNINTE